MLRDLFCWGLGMRRRVGALNVVAIAAYHVINRVAVGIVVLLVYLCKLRSHCWPLSTFVDCAVMPLLLLPQLQHQNQIHPFRR